ncbi:ADP-ribose diphosphatase [uncultured Paraglaciecola sp.]|uniref:ADP-ribose diphosphatase n=1 Tax=uncultured Paraglaciecola sp. TaxID=1765024 RepID=UPI00259A62F7|nr:ADP-ribose diphosphatase [uncultured Paraglaciecola sp.]
MQKANQESKPSILQFSTKDVEIVKKEPLFEGFFKMVKYAFKHKLYEGGWSKVIEREVFERGNAVAVLLYDPALEEFVMIEQFRIGALSNPQSPWLLEVVAGIIDPDETPENVCRREALEEAGVTIKKITPALNYLPSPGGTTERLYLFVGEVDASQAGGVHGLDYESEDILVHRVSVTDAMAWLEEGKIDNSATIIVLQWFAMNKQKILETWSNE